MSILQRMLFLAACSVLLAGCGIESISSDDQNPSSKPNLLTTVTGQLTYQDRLYNSQGFISEEKPLKAIRNVPVELRDANDLLIAQTSADDQGRFSMPDVPEDNYLLRVIAETEHSSGTKVTIRSASGQRYAIEQEVFVSPTENTLTFNATTNDRVAGIFNMLDVMTLGLDFVDALALNHSTVDDLNVYWQWGRFEGSYTCHFTSSYCTQGAGIYVLSDPLVTHDTDEFDDDVLWHEFAHHLEFSWGMLDSPGGAHSLISRSLDMRLSWSEGMASAFSLSLKKWLRSVAPDRLSIANDMGEDYSSYYIDTIGTSAQISVDLLNASSAFYRNVTNEAAVASGILRLQNITGIYTTWQQLFNTLTENSTADTMDAFWDGMVAGLQPSSALLEQWQWTLAAKHIDYQQDAYESDDSVYSALQLSLDEEQSHTLYRTVYSVDEDWYQLLLTAGQSYRIETFNLINGADTELKLYAYDGAHFTLIASNDDAEDCGVCVPLHDGKNFASVVNYTPSDSAIYYVSVRNADAVYTDPISYGYLGRYGGYSIRYQQQ
jgi:hypothetical protein